MRQEQIFPVLAKIRIKKSG